VIIDGPRVALSVDVEEYFHAWALSSVIAPADWPSCPSRVEFAMRRVLDLLAATQVTATCFVLGWVAERCPDLVRAIVADGHELASHGYAHLKVGEQSPAAFTEDVHRARAILEDLGGVAVHGYRAPSFSIGAQEWWAFDRLAEAGYRYSSSLNPIHHDHYGLPEAPRHPFRPTDADLVEVPVATLAMGWRIPCGGGGYFRLLPYAFSRACLTHISRRERLPVAFYFHPWEIDAEQPRVAGLSPRARFRHYVNLTRMEGKLARLVRDFAWVPVRALIAGYQEPLLRWEPGVALAGAVRP
jgi:polysaccharide deacetylase family protein (PEP-CTERM system associated)